MQSKILRASKYSKPRLCKLNRFNILAANLRLSLNLDFAGKWRCYHWFAHKRVQHKNKYWNEQNLIICVVCVNCVIVDICMYWCFMYLLVLFVFIGVIFFFAFFLLLIILSLCRVYKHEPMVITSINYQ